MLNFLGQVAATVAFVLVIKYLAKILWEEYLREFKRDNPQQELVKSEITLQQALNGLFHLYSSEGANSIEITRNTDDGISRAVWEVTVGNRQGMASADPIYVSDYHDSIEAAYNEVINGLTIPRQGD